MAQITNVFRDFEPTTEWVQDSEFDTLLIYLPGFKKEQLKVQVTSSSNLSISGERSLGDNKWSRFRKELRIPSNYEINEISAKYENGILKIKLPKVIRPTKPQEETANDQLKKEDQTAPEVPPEVKIRTADAANANAASQNIPDKDNKLTDAKGKNTEATNIPGKTWMASLEGNHGIIQEASNISKSKPGYCKKAFGDLVTEMKKPRSRTTNLIVAAGLFALVLGLYVNRAIRSDESNN